MKSVVLSLFVASLVGCAESQSSKVQDASVDAGVTDAASVDGAATLNKTKKEVIQVSYHSEETQQYPQVGGFCCDGWGIRQCVLNNLYPLGSSCVCFGKGAGFVCG